MWGQILEKFDDTVNTACLEKRIAELKAAIESKDDGMDPLYRTKKKGKKQVIIKTTELDETKSQQIVKQLLEINTLKHELDSLENEKKKRVAFMDTLAVKAGWSTRKWFFITAAGSYGGVSYKFYNKGAADQKLITDMKSFTRTATLSFNLLYKSTHPFWYTRLLNNSLLTLGLSYGHQNNFDEFNASDYKQEQRTDSAITNTTYTKIDTKKVYTDVLKEYNVFITYLEITKLFGKKGTFGLRNRLTFESPEEKAGIKSQTNWEVGLLYNTTSKKDKDVTKFSVELFIKFKDLAGKNVKEEDKPQKFYDRQTIGLRTNLPFKFSSL